MCRTTCGASQSSDVFPVCNQYILWSYNSKLSIDVFDLANNASPARPDSMRLRTVHFRTHVPCYFYSATVTDEATPCVIYFPLKVCAIAQNVFGDWVGDSTWLDHVIVSQINASVVDFTGYMLDGDNVEDIGYVQVSHMLPNALRLFFSSTRGESVAEPPFLTNR